MNALFQQLSNTSDTLSSFNINGATAYQSFSSFEEAATIIDAICAELGLEKQMAFLSCPVVRLASAGVKVTPRSPRQGTQGYDVAIYPDAAGDRGRWLYLSVNVKK